MEQEAPDRQPSLSSDGIEQMGNRKSSPQPVDVMNEVQPEERSEKSRIVELKRLSAEAYQRGDFQKATDWLSQALLLVKSLPSDAPNGRGLEGLDDEVINLYSDRSAAYASLSRKFLLRPADRSEVDALYGPDPGCISALSLSDAQKVVAARPRWSKAYSLLGAALQLLERYEEALKAFKTGLEIEPEHGPCKEGVQAVLRALEAENEEDAHMSLADSKDAAGKDGGEREDDERGNKTTGKRPRNSRVVSMEAIDDCECTLCLKLLFEPVTTPCGHSFCRPCLVRALDHRNKCPVCRTVIHVGGGEQMPITVVLHRLLQRSFPQEYAERAAEEKAAVPGRQDAEQTQAVVLRLPLFVMSTIMPGERMSLNIFEPRYRLLLRRCMEGNRRLGMAQVSQDGLEDVAVEAEVAECVAQPDGRYYVEVEGRRRIKILSTSDLDGYRVARAEVIPSDDRPQPDSPEAAALREQARTVLQHMDSMLAMLLSWAGRSGGNMRSARIQEMVARAGVRPTVASVESADGIEALSFWAAALVLSFSPFGFDYDDRCKLLRTRSTSERLRIISESGFILP